MNARFYIPPKLRGFATYIWEQRAEKPMRWQILPSGHVELIFRLGPSVDYLESKWMDEDVNPTRHLCFQSGLHTRPLKMKFTRFHFLGIQLKPIAIHTLFKIPAEKIRDWALDGELIIPELDEMEEKLKNKTSFYQKARWLENYIYHFLKNAKEPDFALKLDQVVTQFVQNSSASSEHSIEDIAGYSRTHTFRLFKEWFGLSPARYVQLQRYVHALNLIHHQHPRLTDIGFAAGYYDQPHLIHTFRAFTGITPGEYLKTKNDHMPGQILW